MNRAYLTDVTSEQIITKYLNSLCRAMIEVLEDFYSPLRTAPMSLIDSFADDVRRNMAAYTIIFLDMVDDDINSYRDLCKLVFGEDSDELYLYESFEYFLHRDIFHPEKFMHKGYSDDKLKEVVEKISKRQLLFERHEGL